MARVQAASKGAPVAPPATSACAECGADVSKARKFPASQAVGETVCCTYCAAISVRDGAKFRMLRTHE